MKLKGKEAHRLLAPLTSDLVYETSCAQAVESGAGGACPLDPDDEGVLDAGH